MCFVAASEGLRVQVFQYLPFLLFVGGFPTFDQDLSSVKGISLSEYLGLNDSNERLYRSGLELLFG